jgi:transposase
MEKIWIVEQYVLTKNSTEVLRRFQRQFDVPPPCRQTVRDLYDKFHRTGSVADKPRSGRPVTSTGADQMEMVSNIIRRNENTSVSRLSIQTGIEGRSVRRILRKLDLRPWRPTQVQALGDDDYDRRMEFCATWLTKLEENAELSDLVLWSDESVFKLNGNVNRHNCVYWSERNPHVLMEQQHQAPGVCVWAGMWSGGIIGPYFFESTVTAEAYREMLVDFLLPRMLSLPRATEMWFMQDGASSHYATIARNVLDAHFPGRWIGRRGTIEWPPRSCDLTPLDFFLWGYLKDLVYSRSPRTLLDLQYRIVEAMNFIPLEMILRVIRHVPERLRLCYASGGAHVL